MSTFGADEITGVTFGGDQIHEITMDGDVVWTSNFYTEDFEDTTVGNLPSDWEQNTTDTSGYFEVSDTRSQNNTQSLRAYEPDSGSGSTIHAGTNSFSPSGDYEVTFYHLFDRDILDNQYSNISIGNADDYYGGNVNNTAWRISFDHGDTQDIEVLDGDTWRTIISNFNMDYWYRFDVRTYFGSNEWEVDVDGTTYGPYSFPNNCSPSDVPYFRYKSGNCEGFLDNIEAKSI